LQRQCPVVQVQGAKIPPPSSQVVVEPLIWQVWPLTVEQGLGFA
jgi:hypothetical protein